MSDKKPPGYEGSDAEAELLPRDPPPRIARALSNFLIAVFGAIVAFAALVPLPESVRCRFVLASEGGSAPVTAEEAGVVAEVFVQLGQVVESGHVLARIVPYVAPLLSQAELRAREARLMAESTLAFELDSQMGARHESRRIQFQSDLRRAGAAVEAARARRDTLARLVEQAANAAREGAISEREMLEKREVMEEAGMDLAEATRAREAARTALDAMDAARAVEISERELVHRRIDGDLLEVRAGLEGQAALPDRVEPEGYLVRAPHDGAIVSLPIERPGVVVERGQALATLARPGGRLRAEITIPERSAARVVQGQTVRLLFDAYPYTRHGFVRGLLTWVSPAAQSGNLAAFARLEDATVLVDERRQALRPGMGGEARIDIGASTLLEYVFEPLQKVRGALMPDSADAG